MAAMVDSVVTQIAPAAKPDGCKKGAVGRGNTGGGGETLPGCSLRVDSSNIQMNISVAGTESHSHTVKKTRWGTVMLGTFARAMSCSSNITLDMWAAGRG